MERISGTRNPADTVVTGGPTTYTINPNTDFSSAETVTLTVFAAGVTDQDSFDPPDNMASDFSSSFTVATDTPPTAVDDTKTVNEDSGATAIDVLANDTDPDGGPKNIASVTQPANGTVVPTGGTPGAYSGLTYQPNANYCNNPPGTTLDTFTYTLNGGSTGNVTVTVTCIDDAPTLTAGGSSPSFTEDGPPVAVDPGITVADVDNATLASGTISITGNYQSSEDVLAFTNDGSTMGNIAVQSNAGGVLTLTSAGATATVAQWQSALRSVTYNNSSQNPNTANRTISFKVNDGALNSNTVSKTLAVTAVNDAPVLGGVSGGFTYTENDAATAIAPAITVTDVDSATLTSATISISANFQSGQDVLSFTNDGATMGNIAVGSNAGGVLTLTSAGSTATLAQWQSALRAVKYNNTSDNPNTSTRTVSFQADDGGAVNNLSNIVTRTITVTAVNDAPVVTTSGGSASFTEDGPAVAADPGVTITDVDSATLASGTISITGNFQSGQDVLAFTNDGSTMGNIAVQSNAGGVLTLTSAGATATVAQWQSALRSVTYNNTSQNPNTTARTVSFAVNDGALASNTATRGVTVTAVNDAPTFSAPASFAVNEDTQFTFTGGNAITVSDVDVNSGTMTLTLSALHGTLTLTTGGGGTFTNNGTSSVTFAGTLTQVNAALANSKYQGNQDYNGSDTISLNINDQGNTGTGGALQANASITVTVNAVNDAPVAQPKNFLAQANMKIGLTGFLSGVTDADSGVNGCSPTFTLASVSATTPAGGTVTITNAATGTVDFDPPPGATGNVTFTYTVSDNGCPGTATSAPATATVNVSGPVIWFVNPSAASNGDGRLSNPFKFLSGQAGAADDVADVDASGHRIFIYTGTISTGITLNSNEWLIGQGATGTTFDAYFGLTVPAGTIARPSINGTNPNVNGAVGFATSDKIDGLDMDGASASLTNSGTTATSFIVNVGRFRRTAAGVAVSLAGTGNTGSFTFKSLSATAGNPAGGNKGVTVSNLTGTFTISGTDTGVTPNGGTVSGYGSNGLEFISVANANPALTSVTLKNMNLTNNAQTNGEANPTLCGTTGLNGQNVNCTADVYLGTVSGITLDNININGSNQNGINGLNVVDLKIQNGSTVQNCGNESGESGVFIQNLTGLNNALTGSTFSNNRDWQFAVADFTSGALGNAGNPFNVSGCTFTGKGNTTTSEDGFFALIRGTTTANINIGGGANTASHFKSNFSYGVYVVTADTASATLTVNGCDFGTGGSTTYNNSGIGIGISGASILNYTISNNTIIGVAVGTPGNGVGIIASTGLTAPGASIVGTISGNTIGDAAISGSGGFNNAAAMQLLANGGGDMVFAASVTGNHIHNPTALGIQYIGEHPTRL